jgi:hypothetical protein
LKNEKLEENIEYLKVELEKAKVITEKAKYFPSILILLRATYDKLRKERDFHKMHHHRVQ